MEIKNILFFYSPVIFSALFVNNANGAALILNSGNFDKIIANNELVFINFYADWCRFSNLLAPIWDQFADKFKEEFPSSNVIIAKLDAHVESDIASRYHVNKYPTMKLLRNGQPAKKEYRGQRSPEAFIEFIREEMKNPIEKITSLDQLNTLPKDKRSVIGYFEDESTKQYKVFEQVAKQFKSDCQFYAGFGDTVRSMHPPNQSILVFRSPVTDEEEVSRDVNLDVVDEMSIWVNERCIPSVRTITFENAEELTEEGLPFLILFHDPNDLDVVSRFTKFVQKHLHSKKQQINFLHADGHKFSHPLSHLGLSTKDLPQIVIDSFRHMYIFPGGIEQMEVPGKLEKFVDKLFSGQLHREFHYGPDSDSEKEDDGKQEGNTIDSSKSDSPSQPTTPPKSQFRHLMPSENRYTFKDEF